MKIFRISLFTIALLLLLYLILSLIGPSSIKVSSSKIINAPQNIVIREIADLSRWSDWSPYPLKNPLSKSQFSGAPFHSGQSILWTDGPASMKQGILKLDKFDMNRIEYSVDIQKTAKCKTSGQIDILINDFKTTKLNWSAESSIPFWKRPGFIFKSNEASMNPDLEISLTHLDSICQIRYSAELARQFSLNPPTQIEK